MYLILFQIFSEMGQISVHILEEFMQCFHFFSLYSAHPTADSKTNINIKLPAHSSFNWCICPKSKWAWVYRSKRWKETPTRKHPTLKHHLTCVKATLALLEQLHAISISLFPHIKRNVEFQWYILFFLPLKHKLWYSLKLCQWGSSNEHP